MNAEDERGPLQLPMKINVYEARVQFYNTEQPMVTLTGNVATELPGFGPASDFITRIPLPKAIWEPFEQDFRAFLKTNPEVRAVYARHVTKGKGKGKRTNDNEERDGE